MAETASPLLAGSRMRLFKDRLTRYSVSAGGAMVLVALLLIFFYLLYVVFPIFRPVTLESHNAFTVPSQGKILALGMEEQNEIGFKITDTGDLTFFAARQLEEGPAPGTVLLRESVLSSENPLVLAKTTPTRGTYLLSDAQGKALVFKPSFQVSFPDDKRTLTPYVQYPLGNESLTIDSQGHALQHLVFETSSDLASFAAVTDDGRLLLTRLLGEEDFLTEEVVWNPVYFQIGNTVSDIQQLLMTPDQRLLFVRTQNVVDVYDISSPERGIPRIQALDIGKRKINSMILLAGASSLILAEEKGPISQWFQVPTDNGREFRRIREFEVDGDVVPMAPEFYRRSFMVATQAGNLSIYHATGNSRLVTEHLVDAQL